MHVAPPRSDRPDSASDVRYSLFSVQDHYPDLPRTIPELYDQVLAQCRLAEGRGYDTFFVAEHHFHEYGAVPHPAVMLANLAAQTTHIRLGSAISILTFHHPLTVAESYAVLDIVSRGRVTLGVGSGYLKHEFAGYAVDPAEKRERFDESLVILERALAGERFSHAGRFHRIDEVQLQVRPIQQPSIPIYSAILARPAAYFVGRQGRNVLSVPYGSVDTFDQVGELAAEYRRGIAESGRTDGGDFIACFHTHVADTDDACRQRAARAFDRYVETRLYAKRQTYDDIWRSGLALFGSPDTVAAKVVRLHDMGIRHVMLLHNFGAMAPADVEDSIRLYADEVMPRVHRTLGLRNAA